MNIDQQHKEVTVTTVKKKQIGTFGTTDCRPAAPRHVHVLVSVQTVIFRVCLKQEKRILLKK